jgi:hypothetical protein
MGRGKTSCISTTGIAPIFEREEEATVTLDVKGLYFLLSSFTHCIIQVEQFIYGERSSVRNSSERIVLHQV